MKSLILIILMCFVLSAQCALYVRVQDENPDHENECFDEIDRIYRRKGELMKSINGTCTQVSCHGTYKEGKVLIEIASCGAMTPPKNCTVVQDLRLPYPECCPRIECPQPKIFSV